MSRLMFTKKEIAMIIGVDVYEFLELVNDEDTLVYNQFNTGRLQSEAEIRTSIFDLARAGSSPAQTDAMKLIMDAKLDDL